MNFSIDPKVHLPAQIIASFLVLAIFGIITREAWKNWRRSDAPDAALSWIGLCLGSVSSHWFWFQYGFA
ncbi:MAG: hypothetical protein MK098_14885 [Marinovum sp.]|nr:hypothetical protein [Marinovum sp.]